jgi:copper chaperone CopZ
MKTVVYSIPNISCNHCVHTINSEIGELPGIQAVAADLDGQQATITFDAPATEAAIIATLTEINYPPALS